MSTELTIAIIASIASLAVAIVSLLTAIISARQTTNANLKLESLRDSIQRKHAQEEFSDIYLNASLSALNESIQVIQCFKDCIQVILSATKSSLDSDLAIASITTSREEMFSSYEKNLPNLTEQEAKVFHQAKNKALILENLLRKDLDEKPYASEMTDEVRRRIIELRGLLTDSQQLLRDSRSDKLAKRMGIG